MPLITVKRLPTLRSRSLNLSLFSASIPTRHAVRSFRKASYSAGSVFISWRRVGSFSGSHAMVPKMSCSSSLNFPPNHTNGEHTTTPGTFSISLRWRCGSVDASETLFRTHTRSELSPSDGGFVSSRSTTISVTSRKRLAAALSTLSSRRRLLRSAFLMMKPAILTASAALFPNRASAFRIPPPADRA